MRLASTRWFARLALSALAGAVMAAPAGAQRTERFTITGSRAAVYNLAGEVTVAAGTGTAVVVEVTRRGQDAAALRVSRNGGAVRVVTPGDRVVYPPLGRSSSQFPVRRDGRLGRGLRSRRVTVAGSGAGTRAHADVRVLVPAGRAVVVHQGVGRVQVSNVNARLQVFTVTAPVRALRTRGALDVAVLSGAVEVRDAQGDVALSTGSGTVTFSGVRGTRVEVETGSGAVTGSDVRAEELTVDVGSGAVELARVSAREVEVEMGNGAVRMGLVADARSVEVETGSGAVDLTVPAAFGAEVQVSTGSGGIAVDVPVARRQARRDFFRGVVGDGNGRVIISTGSGGVRIRRG
ncbi:MAG TPA: DUF4097 family beta strand repeat-containing protein [Longimicrobium sp.]|nr:DUF4097 family beta strand repeat-containing protein [Longimicrobium sp.]